MFNIACIKLPATLIVLILFATGCGNVHDEKIPKEFRSDLLNIWGTSDSNLIAVGQAGLILHYNGDEWTKMNSGTKSILKDVSGTSSNDVYVVGYDNTLLHFDGKTWMPVEVKLESSLSGIWIAPTNEVFVVGEKSTILHYDGKNWRKMNVEVEAALSGIWGSSSTDIYAVGRVGSRGIILHYNGKDWSSVESPVTSTLLSISGVSASEIYAVGSAGTIVQFDGQNWKVLMQKDPRSSWNGVFAFPSGIVVVVGLDSKTGGIEMSYMGDEWVDARTSGSVGKWSEINSVWGFSYTNYFKIGLDGIKHVFYNQETTKSNGEIVIKEKRNSVLAKNRFVDPNGFFKIVPPAEWQIQTYPEDPRGKVAFIGPADFELRILAKGLEYNSFEEMMEELKGIEKGIEVNTNIEKIVFTDIPAVKRVFIFKGLKMLFIDFMIGNTSHNLMYSSSPNNFEKYLSLAWESLNTYEPTLRGVSAEDVKNHSIARSVRLSTIFFEQGNYDLALELIKEGLDVEPNNAKLLILKKEITKEM